MPARQFTWLFVAGSSGALACMLLFYSTLPAAPPAGQPPFVDATVQREEMIRELRGIRDLLKEQNSLLGKLVDRGHDQKPPKR